MKITQFDDKYNINLGIGGTTLVSASGSNGGFGGDVTGTWGDLSVVGLRQQISIGSNLVPVNLGDVLTIVSTGATPTAVFAAASNSLTTDTIVTVTAGATQTIDFSLGTIWDITLTANCTFTITNPPASGIAGILLLIIRQGGSGSYTVTWPATVYWDNGAGLTGGSPPTLHTAVGARDVITVITEDGGASYGGSEGAVGGSSLSFGSNSMAVGATNQAGTSGTYVGSDHRHFGLHSISSSSSNTLWRPTINLRAGANVGLTATDSDGDGNLDTVTITSTGTGGGGGGSSSGAILGVTKYIRGTDGAIASTGSGTLVDVDATNATVTFTAPASGNVLVRWEAFIASDATHYAMIGLRESTTIIAGPDLAWNATAAGARVGSTFYVTGISAGSHTYKAAIATSGGSSSVNGGPLFGSLIMTVTAV